MSGVKKFDTEGLNSLRYEIHKFERKVLYTWILAEIKQESVNNNNELFPCHTLGLIKIIFPVFVFFFHATSFFASLARS